MYVISAFYHFRRTVCFNYSCVMSNVAQYDVLAFIVVVCSHVIEFYSKASFEIRVGWV